MIVAVRDFNFGAMENKGLNVFNSSLLLADPATATDMDYERIESVVAHEYFHNWTGNRITCRDWFQLLPEGRPRPSSATRSFSAARSAAQAVVRIKDVHAPCAPASSRRTPARSPIRCARPATSRSTTSTPPPSTRRARRSSACCAPCWGPETFRAGMDLYFERFDGTAATVEDFVGAFEAASGKDLLALLRLVRSSPARPVLTVDQRLRRGGPDPGPDADPGRPRRQPTAPLPIPVRLGLLDARRRSPSVP